MTLNRMVKVRSDARKLTKAEAAALLFRLLGALENSVEFYEACENLMTNRESKPEGEN